MYKKWIISFLVAFALASTAVQAQPASKETVKLLMDKTGAGKLGVQAIQQMLPSLKAMAPNAPDKFWSEFMAEFKADELVDLIIPIYQKYLSEADVLAIFEFYSSPAGKRFIKSQPIIMQESMLAGQKWGEIISEKVLDKYKKQQ